MSPWPCSPPPTSPSPAPPSTTARRKRGIHYRLPSADPAVGQRDPPTPRRRGLRPADLHRPRHALVALAPDAPAPSPHLPLPPPRRTTTRLINCRCSTRGTAPLHVEAELHHVAVLHDVVLALHADLARGLGGVHRTGRHEVVVGDDLSLDEALLEVRVDHA